jgi:hypothetical protein
VLGLGLRFPVPPMYDSPRAMVKRIVFIWLRMISSSARPMRLRPWAGAKEPL